MRRAWVLALAALVPFAGCGRRHEQPASELELEPEGDTAGLTRGKPLIERIEPYRLENGVLRVRGEVGFPDGTRLQISMYRKDTNEMLARVWVIVANHRFDSPPIIGPNGPLPHGGYRFEYLTLFNQAWQPSQVMRSTDQGRSLRGPGIGRDPVGGPTFYLVEERTL
jgi:hypothetical protein